jgi:glycosyltransferase involved in cell wall biosynthesis
VRSKPVVLVAGPSLDAMSGVTTHVLSLLNSSLREQFELAHFQVGSEGRRESKPAMLARLLLSPLALAAAILRRGASLVHLNTSLNAKAFWRDSAYLAMAKLCGARVVLQKHGGTLAEFCRRYPLFLVRLVLSLPDAIVVLSRAELEEYRAFLPRQNIVLVPNGIDLLPFRKKARPEKKPGEPLRILYVGRLAPGKGLSEILEAMALLRGRAVATRLVIAGGGQDEAALKLRASELGLDEVVSFAGPAHGERKADLLAESDVLLLPSYSEGLPYAVLEGMAAGAVPVVTPVGALPDVVEKAVHGLFVPVKDPDSIARAVAALAGDRAALARMSAASRKRIATAYSLERVGADFAALYGALAAARSPSATY